MNISMERSDVIKSLEITSEFMYRKLSVFRKFKMDTIFLLEIKDWVKYVNPAPVKTLVEVNAYYKDKMTFQQIASSPCNLSPTGESFMYLQVTRDTIDIFENAVVVPVDDLPLYVDFEYITQEFRNYTGI